MHRVQALADRPPGARAPTAGEVRNLIPLAEVISEIESVGPKSKRVQRIYEALIAKAGSELFVLDGAPLEDVVRHGSTLLSEAIRRLRAGQVHREAGYDGKYGVVKVFEEGELG
jgi:DNA helicase II / ATP-dependent DNA helicase PcrA